MPEPVIAPGHLPGRTASHPVYFGWAALFVFSFALYGLTANRGAQWQDSGSRILQIVQGQVVNPAGLALSHPLHHWLGRLALLAGGVEPCLAITLVSAVCAALAVANTFGCVRALTGCGWAALFAATSLALAHTFWQLATIAETYTLTVALLAGECWCLAAYARSRSKYALWAMLLFNGLGVGNHLQAVLSVPVLAVVVVHALVAGRVTVGQAAVGWVLWLLGSLPYTSLVFAELLRSGDLSATMHSALFGHNYMGPVLQPLPARRVLLSSLVFPLLNFPNLLLPAAAFGILLGRPNRNRPPAAGEVLTTWALRAELCLHALFALRYNVVDQHFFFLPLYFLLAVFGGVGAASVLRLPRPRLRRNLSVAGALLLLTTPVVYLLVLVVARECKLLSGVVHNKPYRDDYVYLLAPWSVAERSAERMSREAVCLAGPRGLIVFEDPMARFAINYQRLRAGRSELEIMSAPQPSQVDGIAALADRIRQATAEDRPVVLVPLDADRPRTAPPAGKWKRLPGGDLYLLDVSGATAPAAAQ